MRTHEFISEGKVKNSAIDYEFDRTHAVYQAPAKFGVLVNGRLWKKDGETVSFESKSQALHAANKITASRNITTQVVPIK